VLLVRFLISALYILFACLYCMLPHLSFFLHFFTCFLPYLSFPLRIDLFCAEWDVKPERNQSVTVSLSVCVFP